MGNTTDRVWIVGDRGEEDWDIQGVFASYDKAITACKEAFKPYSLDRLFIVNVETEVIGVDDDYEHRHEPFKVTCPKCHRPRLRCLPGCDFLAGLNWNDQSTLHIAFDAPFDVEEIPYPDHLKPTTG